MIKKLTKDEIVEEELDNIRQLIKDRLTEKFGGKKLTKKIIPLVKKEIFNILKEREDLYDRITDPAKINKLFKP